MSAERRGEGPKGREDGEQAASSRVPPHDDAAEAAVLGAILLDPEAFDRAIEAIAAEDFYVPAHRCGASRASAT